MVDIDHILRVNVLIFIEKSSINSAKREVPIIVSVPVTDSQHSDKNKKNSSSQQVMMDIAVIFP